MGPGKQEACGASSHPDGLGGSLGSAPAADLRASLQRAPTWAGPRLPAEGRLVPGQPRTHVLLEEAAIAAALDLGLAALQAESCFFPGVGLISGWTELPSQGLLRCLFS